MNSVKKASPVLSEAHTISRHDFKGQHRLTIGKHCKEMFIYQAPGDGPIQIGNGNFLSVADHLLIVLMDLCDNPH